MNDGFGSFLYDTLSDFDERMEIYGCEVCSCGECWFSSFHETKVGAWRAGRKWIISQHENDLISRRRVGKERHQFMSGYYSFRVVPIQLED